MITKRYNCNPILLPSEINSWESEATFNGCPLKEGNKIHLFYRAISAPQDVNGIKLEVSTIGHAISRDGKVFKNREMLIYPEHNWEKFGCEDPRVTKINKKYYIFYTALSSFPFGPEGIKIGLAITKDFKKIEKHPITTFNSKAMTLFPEKIKGKYFALLSVDTDRPPATKIGIVSFEKEKDMWSPDFWNKWYQSLDNNLLNLPKGEADHFEVGAPPIKTKNGWLLIYSYIRNYYDNSKETIFEIQAVLLDKNNPSKIIDVSKTPLLVPEKEYEIYGKIPNVIFPSGAFIKKDKLHVFYGATDTVCCATEYKLKDVIENILNKNLNSFSLTRFKKNPILKPRAENEWESRSTINAGAIYEGGRFHLIYRAEAPNFVSCLGYASSKDGFNIDERLDHPVYIPQYDFEKNDRGQFYGCEDPRLVKVGKRIYMFYTAFNGIQEPRVALTSIDLKDFLHKKWRWEKPFLVSESPISNKDACIFPEKIKGKYLAIYRINNYGMDLLYSNDLSFSQVKMDSENNWIIPRKGKWDSKKVGLNGPPIKTKEGWLILYHGISENDSAYRLGAILTDLNDPKKIIARTENPIFEPLTKYEKEGNVPNVVFSCGNVLVDGKLFVYYGGADKVLGVATCSLKKLIKEIKKSIED